MLVTKINVWLHKPLTWQQCSDAITSSWQNSPGDIHIQHLSQSLPVQVTRNALPYVIPLQHLQSKPHCANLRMSGSCSMLRLFCIMVPSSHACIPHAREKERMGMDLHGTSREAKEFSLDFTDLYITSKRLLRSCMVWMSQENLVELMLIRRLSKCLFPLLSCQTVYHILPTLLSLGSSNYSGLENRISAVAKLIITKCRTLQIEKLNFEVAILMLV